MKGKVKWFDTTKGFGFIHTEEGNDLFVHYSGFDNEEIDIQCENCSRKTKKTIGWIKCNKVLNCTCGTTISLETDQFKRELKKIVSDLERTFKNFGK